MEPTDASRTLTEAARLTSQARSTGRWYAAYLVLFAAASVIIATLFGFVSGKWGAITLSAVWAVFVVALSIWSNRHKTSIRGFAQIHGLVIAIWAVLWVNTVIFGSVRFPGQLAWWVAGGVAMAIPCLVGAYVVYRRTRA